MHPELGCNEINKKCHQLRHAFHQVNHTAKDSFKHDQNLRLDEGGPIKQYDKEKPKIYQCEKFILCNAFQGHNYCMHAYISQGRTKSSFDVSKEIKLFPMMQRVVVNSIVESGIWHDQKSGTIR